MRIEHPSEKHIPCLKKLWQDSFGDTDEYIDIFFDTAYSKDRCLVALDGQCPVGVIYWLDCAFFDRRIAYFYAIATKKSHRGKGICSRLMEYAHSHLRELGYSAVILVPGEPSLFDFYGKMGYETGSYVDEIKCQKAEGDITIREINGNEYASLRRKYLPQNGILQENEHIKYLEKQAKLYTGKDFLLSCRKEDDALTGLELLGDTSLAPYIVNALGCSHGNFRTMGDKKPFAMYLSLEKQPLPRTFYFGIAFD